MSAGNAIEQPTCFQFKASFSPCTILQLIHYDLTRLEKQIQATIARAPNMFFGSPVVIDLEKVQSLTDIDFVRLKQVLIAVGLAPIGIRGSSPDQTIMAATAGLPAVNIGKNAAPIKSSREESEIMAKQAMMSDTYQTDSPPQKSEKSSNVSELKIPATHHTKIVTHQIRSGTQVYAKDGDLIVVGQVSAGAELLSDGHIHVYGPLRGRALAGLLGNTQARIFCRTLEAELVSIAGFYLTQEDIQALPAHDGMIQIYLENEQVKIEAL